MQVQKSLNTALLVAILLAQFMKEPQPALMQPFEVRQAAAAVPAEAETSQRQYAPQLAFRRSSKDYLKDSVSVYEERQAHLAKALMKSR